MLAKELMRDARIVTTDMTLADVSIFFDQHSIDHAAVKNEKAPFLGILTSKNLLKAMLICKNDPSRNRVAHHVDLLQDTIFVDEKENLSNLIKHLSSSAPEVLVVSNVFRKVAGTISFRDLFMAFRTEPTRPEGAEETVQRLTDELKGLRRDLEFARVAETLYRELFQKSPCMVHAVDAEGRIVLANPLLHKVLGYEDGQLLNRSIFDIYPQNMHLQVESGLKRIKRVGGHEQVHSLMRKKSGELVNVSLMSSSVTDAEGQFVHTITVSRTQDPDVMLALQNEKEARN